MSMQVPLGALILSIYEDKYII